MCLHTSWVGGVGWTGVGVGWKFAANLERRICAVWTRMAAIAPPVAAELLWKRKSAMLRLWSVTKMAPPWFPALHPLISTSRKMESTPVKESAERRHAGRKGVLCTRAVGP